MMRRQARTQGSEALAPDAESLRCARLGVWEYEGGGLGPPGSAAEQGRGDRIPAASEGAATAVVSAATAAPAGKGP
jgi:hypothetical protein